MTFAELKTELADRGFTYLSDTRRGQYINWARAELDDADLWPYREQAATGGVPLVVGDLGPIETVLDTTTRVPLRPADRVSLGNTYGDLLMIGAPQYYYSAGGSSGTFTVTTYPRSTASVTVYYWRVPGDLVASTDTPAAPTRWHRLIVDIAVSMAYRDSDNHESAEALRAQIERDLVAMRNSLLAGVTGPVAGVELRAWSY